MPYHIIAVTSDKQKTVLLDFDLDLLKDQILIPFRVGKGVLIGSRFVGREVIEKIAVHLTKESARGLIPKIRQKRSESFVVSTVSDELLAAESGKDVTAELMTAVDMELSSSFTPDRPAASNSKVFVVYGRDLRARDMLYAFLECVGLHIVTWKDAVNATGKATPSTWETLSNAFLLAHATVILITPDDEARLKKRFQGRHDLDYESKLTGQARPNVLFEAGMAMGRSEERTVIIQMGKVRPCSDIYGLNIVHLDNSYDSRETLIGCLRRCGCTLDTVSRRSWSLIGNFELDS